MLRAFWLLLLFGMIYVSEKNRRRIAKYKANYGQKTATLIKYDKLSMKWYLWLTIISGIVLGISIFLMSSEEVIWDGERIREKIMGGLINVMLVSGLLLLVFGYHLLAAVFYFKRLEAHGYIVPYNKREFDGMLEMVPRQGGQMPSQSKTSKYLLIICILTFIAMLGTNGWYFYKWQFMGDETSTMLILLLIADAFWIFPILFFRNQMNSQKFKDDVEIDANRTDRMNMFSGIFLIIFLVGIALFIKYTAYSMTEYVFKTWMSEDQKKIGTICDAMEVFCIDPYVIANDENFEETMRSLEKGVDITDWGTPEGEFQESVAMILEITDYSQLKDAFQSTDGPAIVYVKLEGKEFTVQLLNLYPAADREIVAKSLKSN